LDASAPRFASPRPLCQHADEPAQLVDLSRLDERGFRLTGSAERRSARSRISRYAKKGSTAGTVLTFGAARRRRLPVRTYWMLAGVTEAWRRAG
jgi:hypothetical protein